MATTATTTSFEQEVLQSEGKVLVDFWADWCGPCHAVAPVLDQIVQKGSELRLVEGNIEEGAQLPRGHGAISIPTMILFEAGEPKAAAMGAQPKSMLEKSLGLVEA